MAALLAAGVSFRGPYFLLPCLQESASVGFGRFGFNADGCADSCDLVCKWPLWVSDLLNWLQFAAVRLIFLSNWLQLLAAGHFEHF